MADKLPQLLEDTTLNSHNDLGLDPLLPPVRPLSSPRSPPRSTAQINTRSSVEEAVLISHITEFPLELQVNILTYLRAYDLATVNQTCQYYHNPALVHAIVVHAAERVYPIELTQGFEQQPVMSSVATANSSAAGTAVGKKGKKKMTPKAVIPSTTLAAAPAASVIYTFEHLRNMELLVVARVLSRPEPAPSNDMDDGMDSPSGGYYVSKSWCKTALKWLEWQQERQQQYAAQQQQQATKNPHGKKKNNNKLSKKQQRLQQRKYSDANPPWPNVNSDIVCQHSQLQLCSSRKSARARRKLLDKQAWKCLKKLYPESVSLEANQGECWQCLLESESTKRETQAQLAQLKEERKAPLSQPVLRRFYTRTRGVPMQCLVGTSTVAADDGVEKIKVVDEDSDQKPSATPTKKIDSDGGCPLVPGLYYALPRAWCHAWRKYMKTGEGGPLLPPDASSLLCGFHRLPLLPPHLEAYLYGESPQLWLSKKQQQEDEGMDDSSNNLFAASSPSPVARRSVVGMSPQADGDTSGFISLAELGLSAAEMAQQQRAMLAVEQRQREQQQRQREIAQQQQQPLQDEQGRRRSSANADMGEQLDRENYCCVEILAHDELKALEKLWPRSGAGAFRLSFEVLPGQEVAFSTLPCRECDASGMADFCKIPKNSKAQLRAAHQSRVRIHKENKASVNGGSASVVGKPNVQLEY